MAEEGEFATLRAWFHDERLEMHVGSDVALVRRLQCIIDNGCAKEVSLVTFFEDLLVHEEVT